MLRNWLLYIICFLIISCSQQGEKYISDGKLYPAMSYGYSVSDLFRLTTDSVYDNERKAIHIKVPATIGYNSSAWGSIYSGAAGKTKWDLFFLISDFDSLYSSIVFDKNKNCDFTDDTAFTIQKDSSYVVGFKLPQDQRIEYRNQVRFYHGAVDSFQQKVHAITTYKKGQALPASYLILVNPLNIKKIKLPDGNIISLKDAGSDGIFTGKYDKIIAGDVENNPGLIKKPLRCKEVKYGVELPFDNNTYKLISVDKYGDRISLAPLNKIIDTIERLIPVVYSDENGTKRTLLLKSGKQYSVFYIWGTWCIGCLYQSKVFAEVMNEHDNKASFYTLNVGDKRERMIKYISDKKYPFQPYQVSGRVAEEIFFAEAFPTFIVADNERKILLRTSSVDELRKYLASH